MARATKQGVTTMTNQKYQVARTIIEQMGGARKLRLMIAADIVLGPKDVGIKFKGSRKINHVNIELAADDTYTVAFSRIWGIKCKLVAEYTMIYWDQLVDLFERETGLYLTLSPRR
jgi:hypothetical protein